MDSTDKEKDDEEPKGLKYSSTKDMGIFPPELRLKSLHDYGSAVEIDCNIPAKMYYKSGVHMIRMANVYMKEGSLENAYILYHKFMTLFLEKITKHPQYNSVPQKDRAINQVTLREVLLKAETLKTRLLERYQNDTIRYMNEVDKKVKAEEERLELERKQSEKEEQDKKHKLAALVAAKGAQSIAFVARDETKISKPSAPPLLPDIGAEFDPLTLETSEDKKKPSIDRSTKPVPLMHDKLGLRDMVLPAKVMRDFLVLAFKNTTNNKETCGVLAGKLERNKLVVTHLLIPKQTGSPDSCATHNEEDIFDYQDQHNLITLGWIHTHPTQTAFLSSVDLHTHCAYQLMMSEAIAIVCAPKYDETGFFMLTPEYGLNFIASCRQTGFHPHPSEPLLYTKAMHCKLSLTDDVEVVDLRTK